MSKSVVTKQQIENVAYLARLKLTQAELAKYEKEFNDILDYISTLDECDISDIPMEHYLEDYQGEVLQEDVVNHTSISRDDMLKNATEGRQKLGYIRTSKIVNKQSD